MKLILFIVMIYIQLLNYLDLKVHICIVVKLILIHVLMLLIKYFISI